MASVFPVTLGSFQVNSELTTGPVSSFFNPNNIMAPSLRGGARGFQTIPTGVGATIGVGGDGQPYGTSPSGSPYSISNLPFLVLLGMLAVSLIWLRYIHWRA